MARGTTKQIADRFRTRSKVVSRSTKRVKPPGRVFGTSSQFRGVQVGVKGDPRR